MNDRPTAEELLAAVRGFVEAELLPALTDQRLRFQSLIAANVLAIAERELRTEEERLWAEWHWLAERLGLADPPPARLAELRAAVRRGNETLCERIRSGAYDAPAEFRRLAAELRQAVLAKLDVANPRYLAGLQRKDG
jgi:hypothetical protein